MGLVVVLDRPGPVHVQDLYWFSRLAAQTPSAGRRDMAAEGAAVRIVERVLASATFASAAVSSLTFGVGWLHTTEQLGV